MVLRVETVRARLLHLEEILSQLTELAGLDRWRLMGERLEARRPGAPKPTEEPGPRTPIC